MPADNGLDAMGGLTRTANAVILQIELEIEKMAGKVERLRAKRYKMRRELTTVEHELRTHRRYLKALIRELGERPKEG